jgi:hypothetical protein
MLGFPCHFLLPAVGLGWSVKASLPGAVSLLKSIFQNNQNWRYGGLQYKNSPAWTGEFL